eukprot:TRINITY_DN4018_c0_g1_i4.p1 TRINITY_DN4018_c0_g1~~TRINITY_DN4018_c0_g1_i4.p1  ORF type:complete len:288 (+),score=15.57 TRINITY_DN4018_c0_g1_i4:586-1449(+)
MTRRQITATRRHSARRRLPCGRFRPVGLSCASGRLRCAGADAGLPRRRLVRICARSRRTRRLRNQPRGFVKKGRLAVKASREQQGGWLQTLLENPKFSFAQSSLDRLQQQHAEAVRRLQSDHAVDLIHQALRSNKGAVDTCKSQIMALCYGVSVSETGGGFHRTQLGEIGQAVARHREKHDQEVTTMRSKMPGNHAEYVASVKELSSKLRFAELSCKAASSSMDSLRSALDDVQNKLTSSKKENEALREELAAVENVMESSESASKASAAELAGLQKKFDSVSNGCA